MTSDYSSAVKPKTDLSTKLVGAPGRDKPGKAKGADKRAEMQQAVDKVNIHMKEVYKSLTVLADEVIKKLNEVLAEDLPDGVESLKPEDHTAEATAKRITDGVLAMFSAFAKQNPDLEGEELLNSFMGEARKGIKQGYEDAMGVLEGIGALEFNDVTSGIERTMELVEERLRAFEDNFRANLKTEETAETESSDGSAEETSA